MSALDLLKKVKVQTLSFEKHPCRELDQEVMVHYLNGLALLTNEDENVCDKEKEYLSILINSFGLSEDMLETFVNFAENPDEKLILDMMQSFATKDIKYNFMVDAMMIAIVDGNLHENEKAVIEQYFEMFKITKDEAKDLRYIYEMFYTQNGNALYRYFKKQYVSNKPYKIKAELFQYLLDYYQIDMAYELKEDEKKILTFEFFKPTFEKGGLGDGATEIMTKPVNNAQFCIFLNTAFMEKSIEFDGNGKIVDSKSKDLLMDLDKSDIAFIDNEFVINSVEDEEKKVTGVTLSIIFKWINWISNFHNCIYNLSHFHVQEHATSSQEFIYLDTFVIHPFSKEFYFTTATEDNREGYRISPDKQKGTFKASEPSVITNYYNSDFASFRIMKLPSQKE